MLTCLDIKALAIPFKNKSLAFPLENDGKSWVKFTTPFIVMIEG